jgi:GTP-binding protein HflX
MVEMDLLLPPREGKLRASLYQLNGILEEQITDQGDWQLRIRISDVEHQKLNKQVGYDIEKWQHHH